MAQLQINGSGYDKSQSAHRRHSSMNQITRPQTTMSSTVMLHAAAGKPLYNGFMTSMKQALSPMRSATSQSNFQSPAHNVGRPQTAFQTQIVGGTSDYDFRPSRPQSASFVGRQSRFRLQTNRSAVMNRNINQKLQVNHSFNGKPGDLDKTLDTSFGGGNPGGLSISEFIGFDRGGMWAQKAYKAPKEPHWHRLAGSNQILKGKKINVLTEIAQKYKANPAPNQYIKCRNWQEDAKKDKRNFQKFLQSERVTETGAILKKKALRPREPGPATYKKSDKLTSKKVAVLPQSKDTPQLMMLDEARFRGQQTPGAKYQIKLGLTRERSQECYTVPKERIRGFKSKEGRMQSLVKEKKGATIGLYKDLDAEEKTQKQKREFKFGGEKKTSFIDQHIKAKKITPGVGKYEKVEHGFNKLSSGPKSISRQRT